ncbi:apotyrosinase chaperone MelC1 [Streptomyces yangpuensis]|uniref:Tyrosinase cofactor n=1 Tax=Streptomyces yangpuensis TaxID=1648182 RepID=A0ABY5Q4U0_9ACTN|nr:tyrosinase cofactor [Streptomyces yangpuensis]MBZ9599897.1 tyrosinase cofactor [Streptomyces erythrochromogenes]UUY51456.1 tyrosinase cofactor [Streptomyces yangpuensis]
MNKITRRQALGTTAGALTVLGLTAAATGVATSAAATPAAPTPQGTVDEVYQGRRIQITAGGGGHHGGHHSPGQPTVRIDGRELHIMRNADGSWISVINHYETFTEPRLLARAAVRDLQGAPLVPFGGAA